MFAFLVERGSPIADRLSRIADRGDGIQGAGTRHCNGNVTAR